MEVPECRLRRVFWGWWVGRWGILCAKLRIRAGVLVSKGLGEFPQNIVKDGGAGIPKSESNSARSLSTVGLPKASTMTIVCPAPSMVAVDGYSYAFLMNDGE